MNDKEYTCDIFSQSWNRVCLQSWTWYLYLSLRSFTWEYHQKDYEIKSSSSKRDDWWATFIEHKVKEENNEKLSNHEEKKNCKIIISKKNKLI